MKDEKEGCQGNSYPLPEMAPGSIQWMPQVMTLRDWFAGQALAGLMSRPTEESNAYPAQTTSEWLYDWADEMLKAREGTIEDEAESDG